MKIILLALSIVCLVVGDNLPPCPDDPKCPALPDKRQFPPANPFNDPNAILQHIDQYDCSSLKLKKRVFSCFGLLPKVLSKEQKKIIIEHGQSMGYSKAFLNAASDDRLRLINTEFNKYDKFIRETYQNNSPEKNTFVIYYFGIRDPDGDNDETTADFESIKDRALAKIQIGKKLNQDLQDLVSSDAFYVVPETQLKQIGQSGSQLLRQQPFPQLFFLNTNDFNKKRYLSGLVEDSLQYVQRALIKLRNGHPCLFLPCSSRLSTIIQMFQNVLNHPRFILFERPDSSNDLQGITSYNLKQKGITGLTTKFFTYPYEIQILTLIHETTHLYGTIDEIYGVQECQTLLAERPQVALNNADSYALEIIVMGRNNCDPQSRYPL